MMEKKSIEIKRLVPEIIDQVPSYQTDGAAGVDLQACLEAPLIIGPNEAVLVGTGIAIHIQDRQMAGLILPRSGFGHKKGLILGNGTGLIDSDYQGELKVSCWNRTNQPVELMPKTRFAQLIIIPIIQAQFIEVSAFNETSKRCEQGFGHTG